MLTPLTSFVTSTLSGSSAQAARETDVKQVVQPSAFTFVAARRGNEPKVKSKRRLQLVNRAQTVRKHKKQLRTVPLLGNSSSSSSSSLDSKSSSSSEIMSVFGSLVDPQVTYTFRLILPRTASTSSGIWNFAQNLDPTGSSEWSTLDNLFDEYKLKRVVVQFVPMFTPGTNSGGALANSVTAPYLATSINLGSISSNPGSISAALSPPNGRIISLAPGQPASSYVLDSGNIEHTFLWLQIGGTNEPYTGWYGQVEGYGADYQTSNTAVLNYIMYFEVLLRARS